jgi:hypothetical protein
VPRPPHVIVHEELEDHSAQRLKPPSPKGTRLPRPGLARIRIGLPRQSHLQKPSMLPKPSMVTNAHAVLLQPTSRSQQPMCPSAITSPSHAETSTPGVGELKVGGSESMSCREPVQKFQTLCDCTTASPSPCRTTPVSTARVRFETAPPRILKHSEAVLETPKDEPDKGSEVQELPEDMSQTLFMQLFRAYGGMDNVAEVPTPNAKDKVAWIPYYESTPSSITQGSLYHPPRVPTKSTKNAAVSRGEPRRVEPPHWANPQFSGQHDRPSVSMLGQTPIFSVSVPPSSLASFPLSRETFLKKGPQGSLKRDRSQIVSSFSQVASVYDLQETIPEQRTAARQKAVNGQKTSPARKKPRTTLKHGKASCNLGDKALCQSSKLCSLCNASQMVDGSTFCKYVALAAISLSNGIFCVFQTLV